MYSVIVGNVGTVVRTEVKGLAEKAFSDYVQISKTNTGRAGGETVCLMDDEGSELRHYDPERDTGPVTGKGFTLRVVMLTGPNIELRFEKREDAEELSTIMFKVIDVLQTELYDAEGYQVWWTTE